MQTARSFVRGEWCGTENEVPDINATHPASPVAQISLADSKIAEAAVQVPFGGMGDSSSGSREQGKAARDFFTQWKTVYIDSF
jgi:hypothetical protein